LRIARDPNLAHDLSTNGFDGVRKHYTAAHMADRLLECYNQAVKNPFSSALIRG
jgi:hypothetical protein